MVAYRRRRIISPSMTIQIPQELLYENKVALNQIEPIYGIWRSERGDWKVTDKLLQVRTEDKLDNIVITAMFQRSRGCWMAENNKAS